MRQKIKYVIKVVGVGTEYLAYTRGESGSPDDREGARYDLIYGEHKFKCTPDTPRGDYLYEQLQWREFNCPHIVTILDDMRTIEVMER